MRRLLPATVGVLAVVAVIAAATLIGNLATNSGDNPADTSTATATPAPSTSQPDPPQPTTTHTEQRPDHTKSSGNEQKESPEHKADGKTDAPPQWRTVIDGFAADFTQPDKHQSMKTWRKNLARWLTPDLANAYKSTDPRSLPNTKLDTITIESQGDQAVTAIIRYHDLTPTWVVAQPTPDGWRITQVEPYKQHAQNG